jgi:hypothetical protein
VPALSPPKTVARIVWWLNVLAALTAFAAALFWFMSAAEAPPPLRSYFDGAPPSDPFVQWAVAGIKWNRLAALSAGTSAASTGVATVLQSRHD